MIKSSRFSRSLLQKIQFELVMELIIEHTTIYETVNLFFYVNFCWRKSYNCTWRLSRQYQFQTTNHGRWYMYVYNHRPRHRCHPMTISIYSTDISWYIGIFEIVNQINDCQIGSAPFNNSLFLMWTAHNQISICCPDSSCTKWTLVNCFLWFGTKIPMFSFVKSVRG